MYIKNSAQERGGGDSRGRKKNAIADNSNRDSAKAIIDKKRSVTMHLAGKDPTLRGTRGKIRGEKGVTKPNS